MILDAQRQKLGFNVAIFFVIIVALFPIICVVWCANSYAANETDASGFSKEALFNVSDSMTEDDNLSNLMSMDYGTESPSPYDGWAPPVVPVVKILMVDDSKSTLKFNVREYFESVHRKLGFLSDDRFLICMSKYFEISSVISYSSFLNPKLAVLSSGTALQASVRKVWLPGG